MVKTLKYLGPSKLLDAELLLLEELFALVEHADPDHTITIDKRDKDIHCHISPSNPDFRKQTIDNLMHFNRQKKAFRVHFSKSLAISKTISFTISL